MKSPRCQEGNIRRSGNSGAVGARVHVVVNPAYRRWSHNDSTHHVQLFLVVFDDSASRVGRERSWMVALVQSFPIALSSDGDITVADSEAGFLTTLERLQVHVHPVFACVFEGPSRHHLFTLVICIKGHREFLLGVVIRVDQKADIGVEEAGIVCGYF